MLKSSSFQKPPDDQTSETVWIPFWVGELRIPFWVGELRIPFWVGEDTFLGWCSFSGFVFFVASLLFFF